MSELARPHERTFICEVREVTGRRCRTFSAPLSEEMLFGWHRMLMSGKEGPDGFRGGLGDEPMQVVSGAIGAPKIHFEAPVLIASTVSWLRFFAQVLDRAQEDTALDK